MCVVENHKRSVLSSFQKYRWIYRCAYDFWVKENTLTFIENAEKLVSATEKLYSLAQMSASSEYKCEGRIRAWSYTNNIVQGYVAQVDKLRLDYLIKLGQDCGYTLEYARKVATIQYALLIGLQHICSEIPTYDFKEPQVCS